MLKRVDSKDCADKTVKRISECNNRDEENYLAIVYSDDTYSLFQSRSGYDGDTYIEEIKYDDSVIMCDTNNFGVRAGIFSKEELAEFRSQQSKRWAEQQEAAERKRFEELKRKFEGNIGASI